MHYGFSVSWAAARMEVLAGVPSDGEARDDPRQHGGSGVAAAASATEVAAILERLTAGIGEGAIGIGLLMGYAPGVDPVEYTAVARLASTAGVPTFTHSRDLAETTPSVRIDGAEEVVRAASETGAHMHYCHINSTSTRHIDRVHRLVERCRAEGATVTTEAYPYGSGSTAMGAAFLSPERLAARGIDSTRVTYLPTGERVRDATRLLELRATDPGGLVIFDFMDDDDPGDHAILRRALQFDGAIVASDGMPPVWKDAASIPSGGRCRLRPSRIRAPRDASRVRYASGEKRERRSPTPCAVARSCRHRSWRDACRRCATRGAYRKAPTPTWSCSTTTGSAIRPATRRARVRPPASSTSWSTEPSSSATNTWCSTPFPVERYVGCRPSDVAGVRK